MQERGIDAHQLWNLAREVLARDGRFAFHARGHSMTPAIEDGDRVVLARLGPEGPALGDVVLVRTPAGIRLHRVVGREGDELVVRGDAEPGPGERVDPGAIAGRVDRTERRPFGYWPRRLLRGILRRLPLPGRHT